MAGHSKWANIQHRKGAQDAKRGKLFTKFIREITVAARAGGADLSANPRLRLAIDKARGGNMTNDTIDRAIKRGAGGMDGQELEEIRYEGYAPGGVAVMVDCMTDNRNRTVAEVRHAFTKCGGNLGLDGSVGYLFAKLGQLYFEPGSPEEEIMETALEAGADDVITHEDGSIEVQTSPEVFSVVQDAMMKQQLKPAQAEVTFAASVEVPVSDPESVEKLQRLFDMLEDLDDVQNVYSNADLITEN
jgi:YebC/PmpR family DNA-binding regulatory protein